MGCHREWKLIYSSSSNNKKSLWYLNYTNTGPVTTKEEVQKKNDVKARSMLLMALPNEHLMAFNQYKDAKTLFTAIKTRFGEWNTHVVVWRNKPDLDTMRFDDLYNNFKIVEQEVKGTTSSSSSLSSQNMALYHLLAVLMKLILLMELVMLTLKLALLALKLALKITINESDKTGYNKSKVDCFNYHKLGHFTRECKQPRNQDSRNRNQDSSRRTVNVVFSPPKLDLSNSGLEEIQQPKFESYGPKTSNNVSEDIFNVVKESPDAPLVKELVSDDKLEKKTVFPSVAKIEFVRPKPQEKPVRKPVKYAKMYRPKAVNTIRQNSAVVNSVRANQVNAVKASTYTECVVLSPDFKLLDESQVFLRVSRKNNMYSVDLKNVAPSGGLTCLFANATLDESNLWHKRLEHINFKTMNKLNKKMNQFCKEKWIKREFSVARTPQ
nr:ribonuclease H-like domain-containing protein [Tanacetum cinerariifolium]